MFDIVLVKNSKPLPENLKYCKLKRWIAWVPFYERYFLTFQFQAPKVVYRCLQKSSVYFKIHIKLKSMNTKKLRKREF